VSNPALELVFAAAWLHPEPAAREACKRAVADLAGDDGHEQLLDQLDRAASLDPVEPFRLPGATRDMAQVFLRLAASTGTKRMIIGSGASRCWGNGLLITSRGRVHYRTIERCPAGRQEYAKSNPGEPKLVLSRRNGPPGGRKSNVPQRDAPAALLHRNQRSTGCRCSGPYVTISTASAARPPREIRTPNSGAGWHQTPEKRDLGLDVKMVGKGRYEIRPRSAEGSIRLAAIATECPWSTSFGMI
jgi:hypothetical protein